MIDTHIVLLLR